MRTRAISSVGVVVAGLLPAIFGGPAFALLMACLGVLGYREYMLLAARLDGGASVPGTGYVIVAAFAAGGILADQPGIAVAISAVAVGAPLVALLLRDDPSRRFVGWTLAAAGSLYLGLPIYAGVALRSTPGTIDTPWLRDLAGVASLAWPSLPRGLAWILVVVLCTWVNDTTAYLVGRSWGRRPLLPQVSPKKTIEGSIGGLVGAAVAGGLGVAIFGLGLPTAGGMTLGLTIGAAGQVGDLAESLLKREARVKDSGTLIPGHGGVLDRIDALLFALPVGWFLAALID